MRRISAQERESQISRLCEGTVYSFLGWVGPYQNQYTKFTCGCSIHGEWNVSVLHFITGGTRCPKCKNEKLSRDRRECVSVIQEKVNDKCKEKGLLFVGWQSSYENNQSRIICNCPKHGQWSVSVNNFVYKSSGCASCGVYGFSRSKPGVLYALRSLDGMYVKIGITNNFEQRIKQLKKNTPFEFSVIEKMNASGEIVFATEKAFHQTFESAGFLQFDGASEWLKWSTQIQHWLRLIT